MTQAAPGVARKDNEVPHLQQELRTIHLTNAERIIARNRLLSFMQEYPIPELQTESQPMTFWKNAVHSPLVVAICGGVLLFGVFAVLGAMTRRTLFPASQNIAFAPAGITATPGTDVALIMEKNEYRRGEPIRFTLRLKNSTARVADYRFTSGCQTRYLIDGKASGIQFCTQALTSFTLKPGKQQEWAFTEKTPLSAGTHEISAEIVGYGSAKTRVSIKK